MSDNYETTDLNLAAFLMAKQFPLFAVGGAKGGKRVFVFPSPARNVAMSYYSRAEIVAIDYATTLKQVKTLLREA